MTGCSNRDNKPYFFVSLFGAMAIDTEYPGSENWQKYLTDDAGTPYEMAVRAREGFPDLGPRMFCGEFVNKCNRSPWSDSELVDDMLVDLRRAGLVTDGFRFEWVPGIVDIDKCRTPTLHVEPVPFENKVQRRGSATAIYIPKAVERAAGIEPGDLVAVTLVRVVSQ